MASTTATAVSAVSWKVHATTEHHVTLIPFERARQFFAVDASGSTYGSIIRHEHQFAETLHAGHTNDKAVTWGSSCGEPTNDFSRIHWQADRGGTQPSRILTTPKALDAIAASDLWYLLTDGEIPGHDVQDLCKLAMNTEVLNVPIIFVITGRRGPTPSGMNVSVGISFFANASDVLILFKEDPTGHLYIIAGKGCFAKLASNTTGASPDLSSWTPLKKLFSESSFIELCRSEGIQIQTAESRPKLSSGLINLGEQWEGENDNTAIDLNMLLTTAGRLSDLDLEQLLAEEAFNNLSVTCKTRGRIQDLRSLLLNQKVEELNVKLEDVFGASDIVTRLSDEDLDGTTREALQQELREAHANNRRHYQDAVKNMRESGEEQAVRKRNRLVNHALELLAELESSTYTANILTRRSNRAKRAAVVATGGEVPINSLDLDAPKAFRGECRICYGEDEVMSIALKSGADGAANTDNFALDFPLAAGRFKSNRDLIASQYVCFQCALAFNGRSLFREDLAAILPALDYTGSNKKYVQEQLYMALTGGLRTGASGVSQLFMTILDRTFREKEWAGAGTDVSQDPEVIHRQAMFRWVLQNMLENTGCREKFNEQGKWVSYREALAWAVKDFRDQNVDSWIIGYPIAGFMQVVMFGQQLGVFDAQTVRDLRLTKVLHSIASAYLALLFKNEENDEDVWKQPVLELVYARFNSNMVPIDTRGPDSLVNSLDTFWDHLTSCLTADAELLADWQSLDKERAMRRIQILVFWLVYHQKEHTRAKTFFLYLLTRQPLSHVVLDTTAPILSPAVTNPILLSIFRGDPADQAFHARHTGLAPFATQFGPSVLRCCFASCAEPFLNPDQLPSPDAPWTEKQRDALRQARAAHLVKAFAVNEDFGRAAQTGLPMVTTSPAPPASLHCNLHVSVARVWSRMERAKRKDVADGQEDVVGEFVKEVVKEICTGRRGDVFMRDLEGQVKQVLPSFLEALRTALRVEGRGESGVEEYEHDWTLNRLDWKARYEINASNVVGSLAMR